MVVRGRLSGAAAILGRRNGAGKKKTSLIIPPAWDLQLPGWNRNPL